MQLLTESERLGLSGSGLVGSLVGSLTLSGGLSLGGLLTLGRGLGLGGLLAVGDGDIGSLVSAADGVLGSILRSGHLSKAHDERGNLSAGGVDTGIQVVVRITLEQAGGNGPSHSLAGVSLDAVGVGILGQHVLSTGFVSGDLLGGSQLLGRDSLVSSSRVVGGSGLVSGGSVVGGSSLVSGASDTNNGTEAAIA